MSRHRLRPALRHHRRRQPGGEAAAEGYPLDGIDNIATAFSVRRLLTAYEGAALRLRRSSNDDEDDFGFDANGDLDTAAIATFIGAGSGFVKTWYDQSGNARNATQATDASQPAYVASLIGSKPGIAKTAAAHRLATASWTALSQPNSIMHVGQVPVLSEANSQIFFDGIGSSNRHQTWHQFASGDWAIYSGTTQTDGAADTDAHIFVSIFSNSASIGKLYIDGGSAVVSATTGAHTLTGLRLFDDNSGGGIATVRMPELVLIDGEIPDADANTIGASQDDYYGITWTDLA